MNTSKIVLFSIIAVLCSLFILLNIRNEQLMQFYDEKSSSLIGVNVPRNLGFTGNNVKIGVIDTGIDYTHPDLLGFGNNGKVVGGYDFVDNDEQPMDTNGHGTEVAGIIAANGKLMGIAPNAKLFAYRVSADGESVSSDYIIKAIHKAIADKVNIINISLGE
ncbi:MAG: S8 family serine peptidase, partial [Thaumarchaeota archaeon]|nr:S8 family serine peptidase [Nitrososphaerota archaeon]